MVGFGMTPTLSLDDMDDYLLLLDSAFHRLFRAFNPSPGPPANKKGAKSFT